MTRGPPFFYSKCQFFLSLYLSPFLLFYTRVSQQSTEAGDSAEPTFPISQISIFLSFYLSPFLLFYARVAQQSIEAGDSESTLHFSKFQFCSPFISLPFFFLALGSPSKIFKQVTQSQPFQIPKFQFFLSLYLSPFLLFYTSLAQQSI